MRLFQVAASALAALFVIGACWYSWHAEAQETANPDGKVVIDRSAMKDEDRAILDAITVEARFVPGSALACLDSLFPPREIKSRKTDYLLVSISSDQAIKGDYWIDGKLQRTSEATGAWFCNDASRHFIAAPPSGLNRILQFYDANALVSASVCDPAPSLSDWKYTVKEVRKKQ